MIEAEIEVPGVYSGIISFLIEIVARYKISDYLSFYEIECRIEFFISTKRNGVAVVHE